MESSASTQGSIVVMATTAVAFFFLSRALVMQVGVATLITPGESGQGISMDGKYFRGHCGEGGEISLASLLFSLFGTAHSRTCSSRQWERRTL